jgi:hypothetical protein
MGIIADTLHPSLRRKQAAFQQFLVLFNPGDARFARSWCAQAV